jgi:hypothetical protein
MEKLQTEKYSERSLEIAQEMWWVFLKVKDKKIIYPFFNLHLMFIKNNYLCKSEDGGKKGKAICNKA